MFKRLLLPLIVLCLFSINVSARNSDNPFAKNDTLTVGTDVAWSINKKAVIATKTADGGKGTFYHLKFNNKQLQLLMTSDAKGASPKDFKQLEIKEITIDGEQSSLFKWCLNNQERHKRFLQQGLKVKKNICVIDGNAGTFEMQLNKSTLASLQKGSIITFMLKPFRTPLELSYELSDFNDMVAALNAKAVPVAVKPAATAVAAKPKKMCRAAPPTQYKNIKSIEYDCANANAKKDAEKRISASVNKEKEKEKKLAAEKEKQRKLAEDKKKADAAAALEQEQLMQAEAAALAASQAKQAQIDSEITQKMLKVCEKYWNKGEHRCYCEKYIDHAPSSIQASSTCK